MTHSKSHSNIHPLFQPNDIVTINWEETAKGWGADDVEVFSSRYFQTEEANEFSKTGQFLITKIYLSNIYENAQHWQTLVLKPINTDLKPTDFMDEFTILDTVATLEEAEANGFIFMENENLILVSE